MNKFSKAVCKFFSLCIIVLFILVYSGCSSTNELNDDTVKHDAVKSIEKTNSEYTIPEDDIGFSSFKLANLIGISEDEQYWLFQNDTFIRNGNDIRPNDNAELILWDYKENKELFRLKGIEYARYFSKVFISPSQRNIYITGYGQAIDFSGKKSNPFEGEYQVLAEIEDTMYITLSSPDLKTYYYSLKDGNSYEYSFLRNKHVLDVSQKGFYTIEQTGSRLEKVLLYLYDFKGKKQLIGDMAKADETCTLGITYLEVSNDGKYVLYSVGKSPTSRMVYDTDKKTTQILCLGDGKSNVITLRSFWNKNNEVICILRDIYDDRHEKVELRKYKVVE